MYFNTFYPAFIMIKFGFLFLLMELDLIVSKNVEIIEDSPPKIIPVNESFVHINYQNSVVIKDFSKIYKLTLTIRKDWTNYIKAHATRDGSSIWQGIHHQQKLTEGNLLAQLDPCDVKQEVQLNFYSDGEIGLTSYKFDYKPYMVALEHADEWICVINSTFVYLTLEDSSIFQVRECPTNVRWITSKRYIQSLNEGYNEVDKMDDLKIRLLIKGLGQTKSEETLLKNCSDSRFVDSRSDFDSNLFFIIAVSIGSLIFLGIILTISIIIKRTYDKNKVQVDVNPDYGTELYIKSILN